MHLIIYGPEGSGKGTQSKILSEKFNLTIYTSGDLVRDAAANEKGALGDACRAALSEGKYVDDDSIFKLWENKLKSKDCKKGFILDGFPRNITQAKFLLEQTGKCGYGIDKVIYLNLSDSEAVKRLTLRHRTLYEGSTINHDDPKRVKQRLAIYRAKEKELVDFFRKMNLLLTVNGDDTVEKVGEEIMRGLNTAE